MFSTPSTVASALKYSPITNGSIEVQTNQTSPDDTKYTIEQIELLRRLKNSGLSKFQIVNGLETLDKIDTSGFTTPIESGTSKEESQTQTTNRSNTPTNSIAQLPTFNTTGADYLRTLALQQAFLTAMANGNLIGGINFPHLQQNGGISIAQRNLAAALMCNPSLNPAAVLPQGAPFHYGSTNAAENSILSQMSQINAGSNTSGPIKREPNLSNASLGDPSTISDDDEHLIQLQAMSVVETKEEIKNFMMAHGIKQHQVAEKTGVSQSYISQFLHQGVWMKDSTRTNIYKWYLDEKRKREANGEMISPNTSNPSRDVSPIGDSGSQHASPTGTNSQLTAANNNFAAGAQNPQHPSQVKKRDRFVWKESCVALLEKFYNVNPYPDDTKREEIAAACNQLIDSTGQGHDEKLVTAVKVYNWFANRRKEIKRKSNFGQHSNPGANQNFNLMNQSASVLPFLLEPKMSRKLSAGDKSSLEQVMGGCQDLQQGAALKTFGVAATFVNNQNLIKNEQQIDDEMGEKSFKINMADRYLAANSTSHESAISLADQLAQVNNSISELITPSSGGPDEIASSAQTVIIAAAANENLADLLTTADGMDMETTNPNMATVSDHDDDITDDVMNDDVKVQSGTESRNSDVLNLSSSNDNHVI